MKKILQNSQIRRRGVRRQTFRQASHEQEIPTGMSGGDKQKSRDMVPGLQLLRRERNSSAIFRDEILGGERAEIIERTAQPCMVPIPPIQIIHSPAELR